MCILLEEPFFIFCCCFEKFNYCCQYQITALTYTNLIINVSIQVLNIQYIASKILFIVMKKLNQQNPYCASRSHCVGWSNGAGKTAIGKRLALRLDLPFTDVDQEIEMAAGCSVADFLKGMGKQISSRRTTCSFSSVR